MADDPGIYSWDSAEFPLTCQLTAHGIILVFVAYIQAVVPMRKKQKAKKRQQEATLSQRWPRDAPNALKIVCKRKISRRLRKNLHITILSLLFGGEIIFEVFQPMWSGYLNVTDGHYKMPLLFLSSYFIFCIRRLILQVSGPIVTKLCHVFDGDCNLQNWVRILRGPSPPENWRPKNITILARFRTSRLDREYLRMGKRYHLSENDVETAITAAHVYHICWTLVHKRIKIGPVFWLTQSTFSDVHISGSN